MQRILPLMLLVLFVACRQQDAAGEAPPSVDAAEARDAARMACATAHLLAQAHEDLETLTGVISESAGGAAQRPSGPGAVLAFSRAYQQRAELAAARFAHLDSAFNVARTGEDSARHTERARSFRTSPPAPETLEGRVAAAYQRKLEAVMGDPEHRCNDG